MNKNSIDISEHLLAKFLDGKTDARETEQVLAYLNENNETLEDFMNIRSAILIDTEYPIEIDLTECLDVVKQHTKAKKNTFQKRFYIITSFAAAMVAGIVFLFAFYFTNNDKQFTAQDEIINEEIQRVYQDSINELPYPEYRINDNKDLASNEPRKNKEPDVIEEETEVQVQIQERNTAAKIVGNHFEMVKPAKTPYIIAIKNLSKSFDFQYNTNAEKMEVVLKDKSGKILLDKEILQSGLQLKYEEYYKHLEIFWELKATFQDGTTDVKFGILQLMVE